MPDKAQFSDSLTLIGAFWIWDKGRDGANKDKPKVMSGLFHSAKDYIIGLNKDSQAVGY